MPARLLRLTTIVALFAGACSGSSSNSDNTPGHLSIDPKQGYSSADVATVITGTGFLAKATVPQGGGASTYDTQHQAFIGDRKLDGVTWQSTTKLSATVPKGLAPGKYDLTVENALGNRGTAKAAYEVLETPVFSATAAVDHPSVNVGQTFILTVTITNAGDSEVTDFALGRPALTPSDGGSASVGPDPSVPSTIAAHGGEVTARWTFTPNHAGSISIDVSATGVDSAGNALTARLAAPVAVVINPPAALTASSSASSTTPSAGQGVTMTLELANAAGGAAVDVTAVAPSTSPTENMSCPSSAPSSTGAVPSEAAPIRIAGGSTETFTWTCTASAAGQYTLSADVTARDVNTGTSIATSVTGVGVAYGGSGALAAPTFSPQPGTYPSAQSVTISAAEGAEIRYTTDGTDPTSSSRRYRSAITVRATTTIKAIAIASGFPDSAVATGEYIIQRGLVPAATPTFDPAPQTPPVLYFPGDTVRITDTTQGAVIHCTTTTDRTTPPTPSASSPVCTSIQLSSEYGQTTSVSAIAIAPGYAASAVATASYTTG